MGLLTSYPWRARKQSHQHQPFRTGLASVDFQQQRRSVLIQISLYSFPKDPSSVVYFRPLCLSHALPIPSTFFIQAPEQRNRILYLPPTPPSMSLPNFPVPKAIQPCEPASQSRLGSNVRQKSKPAGSSIIISTKPATRSYFTNGI